jgi:hypothetical protein
MEERIMSKACRKQPIYTHRWRRIMSKPCRKQPIYTPTDGGEDNE